MEAMGKKTPTKVSSYLSGLLRVLSKPQRVYFLIYLIGLIWLVKFRSIREIAGEFGGGNTDGLHQFIKASPKKAGKLQEENERQLAGRHYSKPPLLILDDTPSPRNGKKIEGIGIHHGADGFIKGLCAVTAILKTGTERLVWTIQGYRPKRTCSKEAPFKSKIVIAQEILKKAVLKFHMPLTVLMDAWYACAPILNLIIQAGWTFLAAIKRNRIVEVNGRKISLTCLAKGVRKFKTIRASKKRKFRAAKRFVALPKIGTVLLFISRSKDGTRFFVTNNLAMTESQMVKLYLERVWIETFHQDIKQHLGFKEMFMRSWNGVQTHWTLVMIAYNTIGLWNGTKSRSFRQMIRHFRNSVSHDAILNLRTKA